MREPRDLARRAPLLFGAVAVLVVVAVGALAVKGTSDQVAVTSGAPTTGAPSTSVAPGSTSTSTTPLEAIGALLPPVTLPPLALPPVRLPPVTLPGLPPITIPPIDLTPHADALPPAYGMKAVTPEEATPYFVPSGPNVTLSGTVSSTLGLPIGGACVDVRRMTMNTYVVRETVHANALGYYQTSIPNGPYAVTAIDCRGIAPGFQPAEMFVLMAPTQNGMVHLAVTDGAAMRVHLTDPYGAPKAGWCVNATSNNTSYLGAFGGDRTDGNGDILLTGLPPGSVSVIATTGTCDWAAAEFNNGVRSGADLTSDTTTAIAVVANCTQSPPPTGQTC